MTPLQAKYFKRIADPATDPRCRAKAKSTGQQCRRLAMHNRPVCCMHGGKGGAPVGNQNATKTGRYCCAREIRLLDEILRKMRLAELNRERVRRWRAKRARAERERSRASIRRALASILVRGRG